MRSVLVCTDGSPSARVALQYARYLAERMRLKVKVLFVEDLRMTQGPLLTGYYGPVGMAPTPTYPAFYGDLVQTVKEQSGRAIDEAKEVFKDLGDRARFTIREGIVHDCILDEAKTVDLVCLGRQGEHGEWEGDELGSTVRRVLHQSQRPVLVTPAEFHEITKLLASYDGSKVANRALREACRWASDEGLPMDVVTIAADDDEKPRFQRILAEARQLVSAYADVESRFVLLEGEAIESLLTDYADRESCDLIVMGAYGESRIREWLLGSTTTGVLVRSKHPVLLLR